jgi:hypothetical protein
MNLNIFNALQKLYPQVVTLANDTAYDADGNKVTYDLARVTAQVATDEQAAITAKTAALAKLTALGLTPADLTALGL